MLLTNQLITTQVVSNGSITSCQQKLLTFLKDAPYIERKRWWRCYFGRARDFHKTASFAEPGAAMIKDPKVGVNPRMSIARSASTVLRKEQERNKLLAVQTDRNLNKTIVDVEPALKEVAGALLQNSFLILKGQWDDRRRNEYQFVGVDSETGDLLIEVRLQSRHRSTFEVPHPQFDVVYLVRVTKDGYMLCSCLWFESELLACQHILVIKGVVFIFDCHVKHTKLYQSGIVQLPPRTHDDGAPGPSSVTEKGPLSLALLGEPKPSWCTSDGPFGRFVRLRASPASVDSSAGFTSPSLSGVAEGAFVDDGAGQLQGDSNDDGPVDVETAAAESKNEQLSKRVRYFRIVEEFKRGGEILASKASYAGRHMDHLLDRFQAFLKTQELYQSAHIRYQPPRTAAREKRMYELHRRTKKRQTKRPKTAHTSVVSEESDMSACDDEDAGDDEDSGDTDDESTPSSLPGTPRTSPDASPALVTRSLPGQSGVLPLPDDFQMTPQTLAVQEHLGRVKYSRSSMKWTFDSASLDLDMTAFLLLLFRSPGRMRYQNGNFSADGNELQDFASNYLRRVRQGTCSNRTRACRNEAVWFMRNRLEEKTVVMAGQRLVWQFEVGDGKSFTFGFKPDLVTLANASADDSPNGEVQFQNVCVYHFYTADAPKPRGNRPSKSQIQSVLDQPTEVHQHSLGRAHYLSLVTCCALESMFPMRVVKCQAVCVSGNSLERASINQNRGQHRTPDFRRDFFVYELDWKALRKEFHGEFGPRLRKSMLLLTGNADAAGPQDVPEDHGNQGENFDEKDQPDFGSGEALDSVESGIVRCPGKKFDKRCLVLSSSAPYTVVCVSRFGTGAQKKNKAQLQLNDTGHIFTFFQENGSGYSPLKLKKKLVASIIHSGAKIASGHFIAYVTTTTGTCYKCDDGSVQETTARQMMSDTAENGYILVFGPFSNMSKKPAGMPNNGNTCWWNSAMQVLGPVYGTALLRPHQLPDMDSLVAELLRLLQASSSVSSPLLLSSLSNMKQIISAAENSIRRSVRTAKRPDLFRLGVQHDPAEFLRRLYDCSSRNGLLLCTTRVILRDSGTCQLCGSPGQNNEVTQNVLGLTLHPTQKVQCFQNLLDKYSSIETVDLRCGAYVPH